MSDTRTAVQVLRALFEVRDLGDMIYDIREREGEGWHGPLVTQWGDAVMRAKELIEENEHGEETFGVRATHELPQERVIDNEE